MRAGVAALWPSLDSVVADFFSGPLARPRQMLNAFTATGTGSGRRAGPRDLQWQSLTILAVAALEAGLEDLFLAGHAARQGSEGAAFIVGGNSPDQNPRRWLVEQRLMAPNARQIRKIAFTDFGLLLDALPTEAIFRPRRKLEPNRGGGRGRDVVGPTDWGGLSRYVDTLVWLRNAAAHGDAAKLAGLPPHCQGELWLTKADGSWSLQQPHALTALRTVLATFNAVAVPLAAELGRPLTSIRRPMEIVFA